MPYKVFYYDSVEKIGLDSKEAIELIKEDISNGMKTILYAPGNFYGLIDKDDMTLQFMVNTDKAIRMEIPSNERQGSLYRNTDLETCLNIVESLGDKIDISVLGEFEFQFW